VSFESTLNCWKDVKRTLTQVGLILESNQNVSQENFELYSFYRSKWCRYSGQLLCCKGLIKYDARAKARANHLNDGLSSDRCLKGDRVKEESNVIANKLVAVSQENVACTDCPSAPGRSPSLKWLENHDIYLNICCGGSSISVVVVYLG